MDFGRENPSPLVRLPGIGDANWHECSPELETAYLQHLAGVDRLEDATSLQLVLNTSAGGSVAHLGGTLPNLLELNLNGSSLDSLRDLGTGFRLLQVLWVSRCGLKALDGINGLPSLRELYAAYNDISDLQPVDCCQHLEVLDMECNCIVDTDAVFYLMCCTNLQTLTLAGNPAAERHGYLQAICTALPSLRFLDDEPITSPDLSPPRLSRQQRHQSPHQHYRNATAVGAAAGGDIGSGHRPSSVHAAMAQPTLKTAVTAASNVGRPPSSSGGGSAGGGVGSSLDADELAFVVAGIKHARVGVDSHEFREIEMNLLVATADGTEVQLDVRPGTSALLPASASTWVRTLRSSREGSLAALRASASAAAAAARTGSQSPASPYSASPISSRPPSSQQQRGSGQIPATAAAAPPTMVSERWAVPSGPGSALGLSSSCVAHTGAGPWRPGSGTGILMGGSSGGGGGCMGAAVDSTMRPGSGGYGTAAGRPFSARPGTAASFSARIGTSASTGAAPSSASVGLYWAKYRISGGAPAGGGGGGGSAVDGAAAGGAGDTADVDAVELSSSSKLTLGSDTTFGGSCARDLRKWKGATVRAAAMATSVGGDAGSNGIPSTATVGSSNGLCCTLLRGGQLDTKALLEELKRWKLETADKVLFVDPDEAVSSNGWVGADGPDRQAGGGSSSGGGGAATASADILRLSGSHDGAGGSELAIGLVLDAQEEEEDGSADGTPASPLQRPQGAVSAGRRKTVLAKVLRDIAADTICGSGVCISDTLKKGLRPVHGPPAYNRNTGYDRNKGYDTNTCGGGQVAGHTPSLAWGPMGSADPPHSRDRERDRSGSSTSTASSHRTQHHHHHRHQAASKTSHAQQPQQQQQVGTGQRPSSALSTCSSSSCSDNGALGTVARSNRPASRDNSVPPPPPGGTPVGGGYSSSGAQLQRQRSTSRAPGLPAGPSAASATSVGGPYRGSSPAGEVEVCSSNGNPPFRVGAW